MGERGLKRERGFARVDRSKGYVHGIIDCVVKDHAEEEQALG